STSNFTTSSYSTDGHYCSTNEEIGCWYNYYAATAGTVSGSSNKIAAVSDICPKNWHIPTGPETKTAVMANTDFDRLTGGIVGWQSPTSGLTAFGAVIGGYQDNGSLSASEFAGYWWSATASSATERQYLIYQERAGKFRNDAGAHPSGKP
ncbi:MAG: hypothetical protein IJI57_00325, partial [Flexilinea sp.]|nr:hypothetical protein [Flexilinea sp.]